MPILEAEKSPGGISTFATPKVGKNWWKLDAGTNIPPKLELINERNNHWLWKPSCAMPIDEYKAALRLVESSFYKLI